MGAASAGFGWDISGSFPALVNVTWTAGSWASSDRVFMSAPYGHTATPRSGHSRMTMPGPSNWYPLTGTACPAATSSTLMPLPPKLMDAS